MVCNSMSKVIFQRYIFPFLKKALVASHFSLPKYRRFGPKWASYRRIIGAFVSYIGFIAGITGLHILRTAFYSTKS